MASSTLPSPPATRGALLAMAAFALFTAMDCTVKVLGAQLHVFQIVWTQTAAMMAAMLAVTALRRQWRRLGMRRPWPHLLRGLLSITSITLAFASYGRLPLANVYAVMFVVPLLVTALGGPLLGERVGRTHWLAVGGGFVGVLVMTGPLQLTGADPMMLLPIGAAVSNALGFLLVRRMQVSETTESMSVYGNVAVLLAMTPLLPGVYQTPSEWELALSLSGGLLGAAGFATLVQAYRWAPATLVAPFQYTQMPWAVLAGVLLFQDRPEARVLVGGAIVAVSGLVLLWRHDEPQDRDRDHESQYGSGPKRQARKSTKVRTFADKCLPCGQTA